MRVIVCVLGQLRLSDLTWPYFKENVLDELGADLITCGPDALKDNVFTRHAKKNILSEAVITQKTHNGEAILQHRRNLLLEVPRDYDQYILTRSDLLWLDPHPKLQYDISWFMNCEFHFGVSDRHWVFPRSKLEQYCNIVSDFKTFKNIEQCLFDVVEWGPQTGLAYFPMYITDSERNPRHPDELEAPKVHFRWPFMIDHGFLSKTGMFSGRVYGLNTENP